MELNNFYPRSPCGERLTTTIIICTASKFLSTLSLRRATHESADDMYRYAFLSTLSLRRATYVRSDRPNFSRISIHALLAESDKSTRQVKQTYRAFLSTLSLRRATIISQHSEPDSDISIHALLAESDIHYDNYNLHCVEISIHALLAESDTLTDDVSTGGKINFYPRSPCGERRYEKIQNACACLFLSTLSLRRATNGHG